MIPIHINQLKKRIKKQGASVLIKLLLLRYLSLVAVMFSFIGSGFMFFIGAVKTLKSFSIYFVGQNAIEVDKHLTQADLAMISLIESVDAFLFALVLLIFAFGIYQIFITKHPIDATDCAHTWMNISNIGQLKTILIEVIIVILFVYFLKFTFMHHDKASWNMLFLPVSILLLSLSLYLLKKGQ